MADKELDAHGRLAQAGLTADDIERVLFGRRWDSYDVDRIAWLEAGISSSRYAGVHFRNAKRYADKAKAVLDGLAVAPAKGLVAEFGVYTGHSVRFLAGRCPNERVYGFDSFEGLPDNWHSGGGKGAFSSNKELPQVPQNVELVAGWFEDTLPRFAREHAGEVFRYIHMDCDIYSSTRTVLDRCRDMIVPGTVIHFDEYYNYPNWQLHEYLAFQEFIAATGLAYKYVGIIAHHQQVTVQILG
jgi:predicted O-methyltransferase YrrM